MAPPVQPPAGPSPRAPASPAAAPSTTATPVSGSITRADIVTLGRTGDPWAFVPLAIHALTIASDDHEVRFLLAAAYAKLGLRTAATETLDHLAVAFGTAAQSHPALAQLAQVLAQLPDDRVPLTTRLRTLERNLDALASRPVAPLDLRHHLGDWSAHAAAMQCFSARGGNILFRDASRRWLRFADDATSVREQVPPPSTLSVEPVLFDGICPPWLFAHVASISPRRRDGQETRLTVVEPDLLALLDGLSLADLQSLLAEPRVHIYPGVDALDRFQQWLADHSEFHLGRTCFAGLSTRNATQSPAKAAATPDAAAVLLAAREQQDESFARVMQRGRDIYAPRDRDWWAQRYKQAASGGPPLRVLIPTSRFTTFVQHSSNDLAEALRNAGCEVRVLIEPDDALRFSALAFWNIYVDWQPDLVIAINQTRTLLPAGVPQNLPFVTWVQDQAGPLYSTDVGRSLGELDFVVGYLLPELFDSFGYPRERTRYYSVFASETKFHDGPLTDDEIARFTCDVAYVSHHSDSPAQLRDQLIARSAAHDKAPLAEVLDSLIESLQRLAAAGLHMRLLDEAHTATREIIAQCLAREPDEETFHRFVAGYTYPLFERILRHQMISWASELCDARGWTLHLYGRGWKDQPAFARWARGELMHDRELRVAFRAARANLHASIGGWFHQRVVECALSGGLTLVRLKLEDVHSLETWAQDALACERGLQFQDDPSILDGSWKFTPVADHWQAMMVHAAYDRLGVPQRHPRAGSQMMSAKQIAVPGYHRAGTPLDFEAAWLAGDPAESGFWDRQSFVSCVTRAIERPKWRESMIRTQQRHARASSTHKGKATEILTLVRQGLAAVAQQS